jgi:para-aminobenzoate synthetase component I
VGLVPVPDLAASPAVVRAGSATVITAEPAEVVVASGREALDALDNLGAGWWAGVLTYDLGRSIERIVHHADDDLALPDLVLARYDARLVLGETRELVGMRQARARLERLLDRTPEPTPAKPLGRSTSTLGRATFESGVRTIVGLIEAGDTYQVNLTRRLSWDEPADPVALHHALAIRSPAPHAALLVLPMADGRRLSVVSASPERFLAWRDRDVETRPIKGTADDADVLRASAKDRAENVMIVDLARNDLGRVCEYGTIEVPSLFEIEPHPGLFHLVSTVRGRLRADVGLGGLIRATFPPASVTGAPKPRVLQAIEDLEPVRRGVYCGAHGWIDTERDEGDLAVAIRTFTVLDDRTHLGVGGGIVADSDPSAEWEETELKAARLLVAAGATEASEVLAS